MNTDHNLLFGVLALQAELIDAQQFAEACTLWATRKTTPLAELLVERGWLVPEDRGHVEYLLQRRLQKHGGDARASLAAAPEEIRRSLALLGDVGLDIPPDDLSRLDAPSLGGTVDHVPVAGERYTLTRLHARGGIGQVWLARDRALDRDVALKELRPERAGSAAVRTRFLREARITGQLEHPGVVPVYDLDRRAGDHPYYAMRFVKGRTLIEAVRAYHRKRAAGQADSVELLTLLNAFVTVCHTVAYAHARGVIHRDLKGQNVVLGDFGEVVVLDWGLAKELRRKDESKRIYDARTAVLDREEESLISEANDPSSFLLLPSSTDLEETAAGSVLGTPAYMAPEQAAGQSDRIDRRTDVYGLGAILYEILTGQPPFAGSDTLEVLRRVREDEPAPPRALCADAPPELEALCLKALAKQPEDRHGGATELAQQVQQWLAELAENRQAELQRERFFALSLDLMCIAGFDGYFKQLNPAWEKAVGWTIDELRSRPWIEFLHPDDVQATIAAAQQVMSGNELFSHENRYRCKDGSWRWLHWTAQEMVGQQLMYAVARDITEQKRTEETLRQSEERYRSVIAAMLDGIVLLDADGSIHACNASAERILGLSAEQMRGRTSRDPRWGAIHEDGSPFPGETHPPVVTLRTGQPCTNVIMGIHKPDGTLSWLSVNSQPLFQPDGTTLAGVVACFADITEQKRTEETMREATAEASRLRQQLTQVGCKGNR